MIDRRRIPIIAWSSRNTPSSSGPRCVITWFIARATASGGRTAPGAATMPTMPHISDVLFGEVARVSAAVERQQLPDHALQRRRRLDVGARVAPHLGQAHGAGGGRLAQRRGQRLAIVD